MNLMLLLTSSTSNRSWPITLLTISLLKNMNLKKGIWLFITSCIVLQYHMKMERIHKISRPYKLNMIYVHGSFIYFNRNLWVERWPTELTPTWWHSVISSLKNGEPVQSLSSMSLWCLYVGKVDFYFVMVCWHFRSWILIQRCMEQQTTNLVSIPGFPKGSESGCFYEFVNQNDLWKVLFYYCVIMSIRTASMVIKPKSRIETTKLLNNSNFLGLFGLFTIRSC